MLYEVRVVLQGIKPPIWRTLQVPARTSLKKLHRILQSGMGWTNSHLHLFRVDGKRYGEPNPEWDFEVFDEAKITVEKIFAGGVKSFQYEYDMGDGWVHEITLKEQVESADAQARCTGGARACPPEDCGGPGGYDELLQTLGGPKNEEQEELLEWLGGEWDPEAFDLADINRELRALRL
jgi:hypothetical protein